ncbi:hypothetical protein C8R47DRAFT_1215663 [Mycena vitilis]|nr:hypothetical protein C8R47DRAFT_1215663 [Mycena vitilis]
MSSTYYECENPSQLTEGQLMCVPHSSFLQLKKAVERSKTRLRMAKCIILPDPIVRHAQRSLISFRQRLKRLPPEQQEAAKAAKARAREARSRYKASRRAARPAQPDP